MVIILDFKYTFKKSQKIYPIFYDCTIKIISTFYFQRTILIIFFGTMITFLG